jgi:hypothetical protein
MLHQLIIEKILEYTDIITIIKLNILNKYTQQISNNKINIILKNIIIIQRFWKKYNKNCNHDSFPILGFVLHPYSMHQLPTYSCSIYPTNVTPSGSANFTKCYQNNRLSNNSCFNKSYYKPYYHNNYSLKSCRSYKLNFH